MYSSFWHSPNSFRKAPGTSDHYRDSGRPYVELERRQAFVLMLALGSKLALTSALVLVSMLAWQMDFGLKYILQPERKTYPIGSQRSRIVILLVSFLHLFLSLPLNGRHCRTSPAWDAAPASPRANPAAGDADGAPGVGWFRRTRVGRVLLLGRRLMQDFLHVTATP